VATIEQERPRKGIETMPGAQEKISQKIRDLSEAKGGLKREKGKN